MFHYYSLEEVYQYAESLGYGHDDVDVEEYEEGCFEVSFGHVYTEVWSWIFDEGLEAPATDYDHYVWED